MSAFICSHNHIKALAIFAASDNAHNMYHVDPRYLADPITRGMAHESPAKIATYYAKVLHDENLRSVNYRYPQHSADELPGNREAIKVTDRDMISHKVLTPVIILKLCSCLSYQSCETDDYETTVAYQLVGKIKDAAITLLPGYEEAPWGI